MKFRDLVAVVGNDLPGRQRPRRNDDSADNVITMPGRETEDVDVDDASQRRQGLLGGIPRGGLLGRDQGALRVRMGGRPSARGTIPTASGGGSCKSASRERWPLRCRNGRKTADTARTAYTAFERKWDKRCPAVVKSLREGGDELLTFFTFPRAQWKTLRTTNVIERLNEEFRRRVKTQGALPTDDAAVTLLFSLVASGQTRLRKLDGWRRLATVIRQRLRPAACYAERHPEDRCPFFHRTRDATPAAADQEVVTDAPRARTVTIGPAPLQVVSAAPPPEPEVSKRAVRRRFTAEYNARVLRQADACTGTASAVEELTPAALHYGHALDVRAHRTLAQERRSPGGPLSGYSLPRAIPIARSNIDRRGATLECATPVSHNRRQLPYALWGKGLGAVL